MRTHTFDKHAEDEFSPLATGEDLHPDRYPELSTLSPAFVYQFTPVAKQPISPEVVFIPRASRFRRLETVGVLASWNHLWEAAQYRKHAFMKTQLEEYFGEFGRWLERLPEVNIYLVAETETRYDAYAPLYHLLPKRLLDRHALPAIKRTVWPVNATGAWNDEVLPADFMNRLSSAFGEHVWRYLDSGSGMRAFSSTEPIVLLSHNLDFWLPHAITAIEKRMRTFGRVKVETAKQRKILAQAKKHHDPEVALERPRKGGIIWMGEGEAASVTRKIVDAADREGRLRALIDAVKSNRVVDDFSPRWSFA
jgi:hypothetical protein